MAADTWVTLVTGASKAVKDVAKTTRCCFALFYASSSKTAKSVIQTLSTSCIPLPYRWAMRLLNYNRSRIN